MCLNQHMWMVGGKKEGDLPIHFNGPINNLWKGTIYL